MKFEEKLIKLRKEHALSQEELAEKLDVTRQTISKWELGQSKPDMEKLMKISTFFNVSIESLTDDTQEVNKDNKGGTSTMDKPIVKILIIVGIIILIIFAIKAAFGAAILNLFGNIFGINDQQNLVNSIFDQTMDIIQETQESFNNTAITVDEYTNEITEVTEFFNETITTTQEQFEQTTQEYEQNQQEIEQKQEEIQSQVQDIFNQAQQMQQNMMNHNMFD